jgi:hypothetical protein
MRAIALATTVVIALAMSATPAPAADRRAHPVEKDRDVAAFADRISAIEQAWLGYVLSPGTVPLPWIPLILSVDQPDPLDRSEEPEDDAPVSVILEDGAPF